MTPMRPWWSSLGWRQAGVPLLAATLLAVVWWSGADPWLFKAFNQGARVAGDIPWGALTMLGEAVVVFPLLVVVQRRWPLAGWAVVLGGIATGAIVMALKFGVGAMRPPAVLSPEHLHIIGPALHYRAFPSGHTATAVLVAAVVIFYSRARWSQWGVGLAAVAIGLSRIAVGAHWPTDVLGGVVAGWLGAVAGVRWAEAWAGARAVRAQQALLALFMVCGAVLFIDDGTYPPLWPMRWAIGALVLVWGAVAWRKLSPAS
ncbi:MAG: phosphatase PAP2 family protein [Pseudomonadota bacterium]